MESLGVNTHPKSMSCCHMTPGSEISYVVTQLLAVHSLVLYLPLH